MVYAWRGVGKTFFTLELAYAIASGGSFLGWDAPEPRRVLYIDGELPGEDIKKRLAQIVVAEDKQVEDNALHVITPDLQEFFTIPDMATRAAQAVLDEAIEEWKSEVVIFDSLSTLVRSGKENEAESWALMAEWALRQRSQGRTVIFIHHAGKDGRQRGTSKREDILNTTLRLCLPPQYDPTQGAVFEVRWEKSRDLKALAPFEATLTEKDGQRLWLTKPITETTLERVVSLANEGLSQTDIAKELNLNRSNVCRAWNKAKAEGKLVKWPKETEEKKAEEPTEEK
jgi:KaiC/GvpD/RAD55 family RecA-like ATPase